jgi:hypothetical protein
LLIAVFNKHLKIAVSDIGRHSNGSFILQFMVLLALVSIVDNDDAGDEDPPMRGFVDWCDIGVGRRQTDDFKL